MCELNDERGIVMNLKSILGKSLLVPVVVIEDLSDAVPLAEAIVRGGLSILEITFRTECAAKAIAAIKQTLPNVDLVAGTVLRKEQLFAAERAGAVACVSPGLSPKMIELARTLEMPFCPGVATPSEISCALELGCEVLKLFPAVSLGGVSYIKALLGAFRSTGVQLMPTGGINAENVREFLSIPEVLCCGGSWMVPQKLVQEKNWEGIEQQVRMAVAQCHRG